MAAKISSTLFSFTWLLAAAETIAETQTRQFLSRPNPRLQIRADATATVDLTSMPTCAQQQCAADSNIACTKIEVPCPVDAPSGVNNCTTYPLDCYCSIATPLACAWSCTWWNWLQFEDWFAKTCPDAKPVDYTSLPSCARDCVSDQAFDYGCITSQKSCFCTHGSLFGCEEKCRKSSELASVISWYASECAVAPSSASYAVISGTSVRQPAIVQTASHLKWYEIFAIVVAGISFVAVILGTIWVLRINQQLEKKYQ